MATARTVSASERLYRLLLLAYPRAFRRTYGLEMTQTFRDCYREAAHDGETPGLIRFWWHILSDLVVSVPLEHAKSCIALFKRLMGLEKEFMMLPASPHFDVALRTDIGRTRASNDDNMTHVIPQDAQLLQQKGALFVVVDGLAGHNSAEVASKIAVDVIPSAYYKDTNDDTTTALVQAIKDANEAIYMRSVNEDDKSAMGTTCVAAVIRGNTIYVANVGDSRAYIIRNQQMRQVSVDHSWVAEQVQAGTLTEEEARTHEKRNVITRCLGNKDSVEVEVFTEQVQDGDILLLCTDGLTGLVRDNEIAAIVEQFGPEESVAQLIALANEHGGSDNITAVVARVSLEESKEEARA